MCGRVTLDKPGEAIADLFGLPAAPAVSARYNIGPMQPLLVVRTGEHDREAAEVQWMLVPSWYKDPKAIGNTFNARSETVATKGVFKDAFAHRRCLVPVTGFYEWPAEKRKSGEPPKQPFLFRRKDREIFALAGIWDRWQGEGRDPFESGAVLTTDANDILLNPAPGLTHFHHRMPVVVPAAEWDRWLTTPADQLVTLQALLHPAPVEDFEAIAVSTYVNNANNEGAECIVPAPRQMRQAELFGPEVAEAHRKARR